MPSLSIARVGSSWGKQAAEKRPEDRQEQADRARRGQKYETVSKLSVFVSANKLGDNPVPDEYLYCALDPGNLVLQKFCS